MQVRISQSIALTIANMLTSVQILDAGTHALSNAEVLTHINEVEAAWIKTGRKNSVPSSARDLVKDVSSPSNCPRSLIEVYEITQP